MSTKVCCSNPRIILNPLVPELVTRYGNYYIRGQRYTASRSKRQLYVFDKTFLTPKYQSITHDDLDDCYIIVHSSGEVIPLYMEVPCGKCNVCRNKKINAFVQRCELETQMYDCKPTFITLTYDEENKPIDGVNVRHMQLFFKRLRVNLERCGYREKIRYVCVGEYGRRTHRPHYHAIIWNLRSTDMVEYREIREIVKKSWSLGFVQQRLVESSDNKTFYYTAKYLRKDCIVPEGQNKTFLCSSNRSGGIGAAFYDKIKSDLLRSCKPTYQFLNKWSHQVKDLVLSKYMVNRIFPTMSSSVPATLKNSMRSFNVCYANLKARQHAVLGQFTQIYEDFNKFFSNYMYCPRLSVDLINNNPASLHRPDERCIRDILDAINILTPFYNKGKEYFENAKKLAEKRVLFMSNLFKRLTPVTDDIIAFKDYKALKSFAAAAEREIL